MIYYSFDISYEKSDLVNYIVCVNNKIDLCHDSVIILKQSVIILNSHISVLAFNYYRSHHFCFLLYAKCVYIKH